MERAGWTKTLGVVSFGVGGGVVNVGARVGEGSAVEWLCDGVCDGTLAVCFFCRAALFLFWIAFRPLSKKDITISSKFERSGLCSVCKSVMEESGKGSSCMGNVFLVSSCFCNWPVKLHILK